MNNIYVQSILKILNSIAIILLGISLIVLIKNHYELVQRVRCLEQGDVGRIYLGDNLCGARNWDGKVLIGATEIK